MSLKKKLTKNTLANYINYFIRIVVNFFLFPFIVHRLGVAEAGIWFLLSSVSGYLELLDLGIKPTLVKHVAQYHGKGDKKSIIEVVNATFFIFLITGVIAAIGMVVVGFFFPQIFNISPDLARTAQICAFIVAGALLFSFPLSAVGGGILNGLQRYDKTRTAGIFSTLSGALATVILLTQGFGVIALVAADQITNLLSWFLTIYFAKKLAPYIKIKIKYLKRKVIKKIFKFSWRIFVMELSSQAIYYTDRIVIGIFLDVSKIVIYETANKICRFIARIPNLLASAMMPASSELHSRNEKETIKKMYILTTKYIIALALSMAIPVMIFTKSIVTAWVGAEFEEAAIYARIILVSILFVLNHTAAMQILIGMGKIRSITRYQVMIAIANLTLSIILIKIFGLIGVVLGTMIPFVIFEFFYLRKSFAIIKVRVKEYFQTVLIRTYGPALIVLIPSITLSFFYSPTRIREVIILLMAHVMIYGLLFYLLGLVKTERSELFTLLKGFLQPKKQ
ncbi:oligosaccharide flippase family protein [Patescibacteria group bacterium]